MHNLIIALNLAEFKKRFNDADVFVLIGVVLPNKKFHALRATKTLANRIASQLRSEPLLAIIKLMTWEEFQDLHLEVAREVGAERSLRVQLAAPEDLHDPACDYKPTLMPRWGLFRRRSKLREIGVVYYQLDDQTQPYFIMGNYVHLDELDKLDDSAYRRGIAEALRNGLEEAEKRRRNR
jgi:hypothetical protein